MEAPAWLASVQSADSAGPIGVVLVVVVLVAVVEVLAPRVILVARVLRPFVLSTLSRRRSQSINASAAQDRSRPRLEVSLTRMAVTLWASGTTRLKIARVRLPWLPNNWR